MSAMKRYFENQVDILARKTGYARDFLMDMWNEECEEGDADWDYFVGVTLEQDW